MTAARSDQGHNYPNIAVSYEDGIAICRFHTEEKSLVWSAGAHRDLGHFFADLALNRDIKVVVLTGTGSSWCEDIDPASFQLTSIDAWDHIRFEGRRLLRNLLDIEVPVICAVNGPARIHPEIPILNDVVIAGRSALFQDAPHFTSGIVPGDGAHLVWPHVLGPNHGRFFLLTGEELTAQRAFECGAVGEVVDDDKVFDRAMEIARDFAQKPHIALRYTRLALVQPLRALLGESLEYGLALESLAALAQTPTSGRMRDLAPGAPAAE